MLDDASLCVQPDELGAVKVGGAARAGGGSYGSKVISGVLFSSVRSTIPRCLRRLAKKNPSNTASARRTTPATAPPAMAPTLVLLPESGADDGDAVLEAVALVLGALDLGHRPVSFLPLWIRS